MDSLENFIMETTPCWNQSCNRSFLLGFSKDNLDDQATSSLKHMVWVLMVLVVEGIVTNSLGLYVISLSFAMKEGGRWLIVVSICDLVLCIWILPFEVYGLLQIQTVDMPHGICSLLTVADSFFTGLVVMTLFTAVTYCLGRSLLPRIPKLNNRNWSLVQSGNVLLALGISFSLLTARPTGLSFYSTTPNPAKQAESRITCTLREALFLDSQSTAVDFINGLRLAYLILLLVLTGMTFGVVIYQQRRNNVGLGKNSLHRGMIRRGTDDIDHMRLIKAVDTIVDSGVGIVKGAQIKQQVMDILTVDKEAINKVVSLYLSSARLTACQSQDKKKMEPTRQCQRGIAPEMTTNQSSTGHCFQLSQLDKRPKTLELSSSDFEVDGLKASRAAVRSTHPNALFNCSTNTERLVESRLSSQQTLVGASTFVQPLNNAKRSVHHMSTVSLPDLTIFRRHDSLDAHVHSALAYLHASADSNMQTSLRRELVYQRALNRLLKMPGTHLSLPQRIACTKSDSNLRPPEILHPEGTLEYTISNMNNLNQQSTPRAVELSIISMMTIGVILVCISLVPLTINNFSNKKTVTISTPSEAVYNYMWTEIYYVHATLKPLFYFLHPKFRARFLFLFCPCLKQQQTKKSTS